MAEKQPIISIDHVSMRFNLAKEKHESLKEYFVALMHGGVHFDEFFALDDVSFDIMPGDFYGLIGLNGSGKSTLLKIISGVYKPSSGMVARLAFAVATITKPDILIADEILSVGDFLFQEKCERRMAELMSGGTTVILVSHSIDQIERMCNKVAWLDHGHLRRNGPVAEITGEYRKFEKKDAMPAKRIEE